MDEMVDIQSFATRRTLTGIGFRVLAWGPAPRSRNYNSIVAKNPDARTTLRTIEDHLRGRKNTPWTPWVQTPWVSIFIQWGAALRCCQDFIDQGATRVFIVVIDLDRCECLGASHLASHLIMPNSLFRIHEYLVWRGIPNMNDTVLAVLPGMGTQQSFPVHLGTMRIPARLAAMAGGRTKDAVEGLLSRARSTPDLCWIASLDRGMVVRVMQAMCTSCYDDVPQWI